MDTYTRRIRYDIKKDKSQINVNMSFNSKKIFGGVTAAQAKSAKGEP